LGLRLYRLGPYSIYKIM